jgi:hypothetical protein
MAATAEPEDSLSASLVSSSRVSASQQDSQAETSRERPRGSWGGRFAVRAEIGGRVIPGRALLLRCRTRGARTGASVVPSSGGIGCAGRGGDCRDDTISALPSSESERRNWEDDFDGGGKICAVGLFVSEFAAPIKLSNLFHVRQVLAGT